jgi:hypothetical protein
MKINKRKILIVLCLIFFAIWLYSVLKICSFKPERQEIKHRELPENYEELMGEDPDLDFMTIITHKYLFY